MFRDSVLVLMLFLMAIVPLKAQDDFDKILEESISSVNELLDSSYVFLLKNAEYQNINDHIPAPLYFSSDVMPENNVRLNEDYFVLQEKYLKSDLGLRLLGSYNNNFDPAYSEEDGLAYKQRTFIGLEWNVFQSGMWKNRSAIRSISNEQELKLVELREENLKKDYFFARQFIEASFINAQNPYLNQRLAVLEGLFDLYQELYYLQKLDWERLLHVKGEIKKVKIALFRNNQLLENSGFGVMELPEANIWPVFSLDRQSILDSIPLERFDSLKYQLKADNLKNRYEKLPEFSVRPYLRYNYYDYSNSPSKSFGSAGVNVSVPIKRKNQKKQMEQIEMNLLQEDFKSEHDEIFSDIMEASRSFEEKVQDYVILAYEKDLVAEKIKRELRKREKNLVGFNGVKSLTYFDEYLGSESKLLNKKKDIYLRLLDICFLTKGEDPEYFLKPLEYDLSFRNFPGERGVYIWSKLFNLMSNDHLLSFLEDREVNQVLVSLGRKMDRSKLIQFFHTANQKRFKTVGLVGSNAILDYSNEEIEAYLNPFKSYAFRELHLDVEPHMLDNWKTDERAYLMRLENVYIRAAVWCKANNKKLSVSIPFHYPNEFMLRIVNLVDQVYVMSYGTTKSETIARRTKIISEFCPTEKITISLRPTDFASLRELDHTIMKLQKSMHIERYCFNDLRGLNQFAPIHLEEEAVQVSKYNFPFRVETGTFPTRAQAISFNDRLREQKLKGDVSWKRDGTYCVILGYFNNFDKAEKYISQLRIKHKDLPGTWLYLVN